MTAQQLTLEDLLPQGESHSEPMTVGVINLPPVVETPDPDLVKSIERFGILVPVTLVEHDYHYTIVDGRRRVAAARQLGIETVPALVLYLEDNSLDVATLVTNNLRRPNPTAEYDAIARLVEAGATEEVIAQATGMARGTIKERLRLHRNLLPVLSTALREGKLTYSLAKAISRLPRARQEALAEVYVADGHLTSTDVSRVRQVAHDAQTAQLPDRIFDEGPTVEELTTPRSDWVDMTGQTRVTVVDVCVPEEMPEDPGEGDPAFTNYAEARQRFIDELLSPLVDKYNDVLRSLVRYGGERVGKMDPSLADLVDRARKLLD